jgi:hypothetical protein
VKHQFAALQPQLCPARLLTVELLPRFYTFQPTAEASGKYLWDRCGRTLAKPILPVQRHFYLIGQPSGLIQTKRRG